MAWTTPKTWIDGNKLSADELNEQVRDNLLYLYTRPSDLHNLAQAANYTTSSTGFVDVDGTNLSLSLTTGGGDLLVWLTDAYMTSAARISVYFDLEVDGSRVGTDDGIAKRTIISNTANPPETTTTVAWGGFTYLLQGLAAGSHTVSLQWKITNAGQTVTWYVGAGTAYNDVHPQFGVKEL